jgi:hypothetical protein
VTGQAAAQGDRREVASAVWTSPLFPPWPISASLSPLLLSRSVFGMSVLLGQNPSSWSTQCR